LVRKFIINIDGKFYQSILENSIKLLTKNNITVIDKKKSI